MKIKPRFDSPERPEYYVLDIENETVQGTIKWICENPEAFNRLNDLAIEKAQHNEKRISSRALVERMRWDYERVSIPNAYCSVISRLLELLNPNRLGGLFVKAKSDVDKIVTTEYEKEKEELRVIDEFMAAVRECN